MAEALRIDRIRIARSASLMRATTYIIVSECATGIGVFLVVAMNQRA